MNQTIIDPLIGQTLDDKYRLDALLGTGGMGSVYQATHLLIERLVAVKVLNPRLVADNSAKERLRREARAAGRLRHSNAVAVTDFGETKDGIVYIVMELLEGYSLRELLAREKLLEPRLAVTIIAQTASAVAAAHESNIIHRDLKPGNIHLVERANRAPIVKVLDFGIAKVGRDAESSEIANLTTLTETGILIGTPRYMSPEQCDGRELTPASDVYSLGVIFYEMLTGSAPFGGATALAIALQHSAQEPRSPRLLNPSIPEPLERVVLHALAKKPDARPMDAAAFNRELAEASREANLTAPTTYVASQMTRDVPLDDDPLRTQKINLDNFDDDNDAARRHANTNENRNAPTSDLAAREQVPSDTASQSNLRDRELGAAVDFTRRDATRGDGTTLIRAKTLRRDVILGATVLGAFLFVIIGAIWMFNRSSNNVNQNATNTASSSTGQSDTNQPGESIGRTLTQTDLPQVGQTPAREPATAAEFYESAAYYFSINDYKQAIKGLRRALELQPDFPAARNRLGVALMQDGQFAPASIEFRRAIEAQGGNFPVAQYNLGYTLQKRNAHAEAIEAFRASIANQPDYADAYYQIGVSALALKRDAEAIEALTRAIQLKGGNDPDAQLRLGVAYARQKQFAEAEVAFKQAIEQRNGGFAEANYNLALLYETMNRPQDAIREFEAYLQQDPNAFNRRLVENSLRRLRRRQQ